MRGRSSDEPSGRVVVLIISLASTGVAGCFRCIDYPVRTCGNSTREPGEACDGSDLGGMDCVNLGFAGGTLECDPGCAIDDSACTTAPECGNGIVEAPEACDGSPPPGTSCASLGFVGGTLACAASCALDAGGCNSCGNGGVETGEGCDGLDLGGADCSSLGWGAGKLACSGTCTLDDSGCLPWPAARLNRDFNSDGFDDWVVGAWASGQDNSGRLYVYFGGPTLDVAPEGVVNGIGQNDWFGIPVAAVGDLNGDGYGDVAASGTLGVRVFFGAAGASFGVTPATTLTAPAGSYQFGLGNQWGNGPLGGAGDLDGDGYDDLVVGAPGSGPAPGTSGAAYVFFGGPGSSLDSVADAVLVGDAPANEFGATTSGIGDVNGDGFADLAVGTRLASYVHVYFGGAGLFDTTPDGTVTGLYSFGQALARAGDLNGDGYADVAIGAPSIGGGDPGNVFIYFGGPGASFDTLPDATLVGEAVDDNFGVSIAGADVDADGFGDLLVGAHDNDGLASSAGAAYLYRGGPGATFDPLPDAVLTGDVGGTWFGVSVACAGDTNGDGFEDLLVGAPEGAPGDPPGSAFLFLGGPGSALSLPADLTLVGELLDGEFGYSVN